MAALLYEETESEQVDSLAKIENTKCRTGSQTPMCLLEATFFSRSNIFVLT